MKAHKAKKSLGQNFLKSEAALRAIIDAGELNEKDTVLEIGPGKGALTSRLLAYAGKVIAIEKDKELIPFLQEKFEEEIKTGKFVLVEGDILDITPRSVFSQVLGSPSPTARPDHAKTHPSVSYKILANIPYNITGAILKKFLTDIHQPSLMVLLVQKEVAERIVARDAKESLLSISVKTYGTPTYITKVPARYFSPAPKVDSAIIKISNISRDFFKKEDINEAIFWQLLHAGFAHKRKILAGNLKNWKQGINWQSILNELKINEKVRAENLKNIQWTQIYKKAFRFF